MNQQYTLLPALAGGLVEKDGNTHLNISGRKRLDSNQKVNKDTSFILASCTKSLVAAMIMKICEVHGLSIQLTIGSVITNLHPKFQMVTLEHLLCMVSGIVDEPPPYGVMDENFISNFVNSQDDMFTQRAHLTHIVCGVNSPGPAFKPGTAFFYSNLGYIIAAHVIEVKLKSRYEILMQEYLFKPLDMQVHDYDKATGHSVYGQKKYCQWYESLYKNIHTKNDKNFPLPPFRKIDKTQGFIIDEKYPAQLPPVYSPAGLLSLNLPSWLRYLHAVTVQSLFLSKKSWNILQNTGYKQQTWSWNPPNPPVIDRTSPKALYQKYSFGWVYNIETFKDFLFYTGNSLTFMTDIILKKNKFAIATAMNAVRGQDRTPLIDLEKLLNPGDVQVEKYINLFFKNKKLYPPNDPWQ